MWYGTSKKGTAELGRRDINWEELLNKVRTKVIPESYGGTAELGRRDIEYKELWEKLKQELIFPEGLGYTEAKRGKRLPEAGAQIAVPFFPGVKIPPIEPSAAVTPPGATPISRLGAGVEGRLPEEKPNVMDRVMSIINRPEAVNSLRDPQTMKYIMKLAENEQKQRMGEMELTAMEMQQRATERMEEAQLRREEDYARHIEGLLASGQEPFGLQRELPEGMQGVPSQLETTVIQAKAERALKPLATEIALRQAEMEEEAKKLERQEKQTYINTLLTGEINKELAEQQTKAMSEYRLAQNEAMYSRMVENKLLTDELTKQKSAYGLLSKAKTSAYKTEMGEPSKYQPEIHATNLEAIWKQSDYRDAINDFDSRVKPQIIGKEGWSKENITAWFEKQGIANDPGVDAYIEYLFDPDLNASRRRK